MKKAEQEPPDEASVRWRPAAQYAARIGGIIYRNVKQPIVVNGRPALTLHRSIETGALAVSFELRTQNGTPIAKIEHNETIHLAKGYINLYGPWGQSVVEETNGRVWYDLRTSPVGAGYELDCSCLLFGTSGYPLILHPDRTCIGGRHDNNPPDISGLTIQGELRPDLTAISCQRDRRLYLIGIAIENFAIGIDISYGIESNAT